jgi:hypothetical protein
MRFRAVCVWNSLTFEPIIGNLVVIALVLHSRTPEVRRKLLDAFWGFRVGGMLGLTGCGKTPSKEVGFRVSGGGRRFGSCHLTGYKFMRYDVC